MYVYMYVRTCFSWALILFRCLHQNDSAWTVIANSVSGFFFHFACSSTCYSFSCWIDYLLSIDVPNILTFRKTFMASSVPDAGTVDLFTKAPKPTVTMENKTSLATTQADNRMTSSGNWHYSDHWDILNSVVPSFFSDSWATLNNGNIEFQEFFDKMSSVIKNESALKNPWETPSATSHPAVNSKNPFLWFSFRNESFEVRKAYQKLFLLSLSSQEKVICVPECII